jgi:DNA sulfur modification protein DndC
MMDLAQTIHDLKEMYLNAPDGKPVAVTWSGGKDSTVTLNLMITILHELPKDKLTKDIHVIMSDTLVENPMLHEYMEDQISKLEKYVESTDLPIKVHKVNRTDEHGYFYLILGRGYFLPLRAGGGRWCTDRLKIKPMAQVFEDLKPSYVVIGTRSSESVTRGNSIKKHLVDYKTGSLHGYTHGSSFMAIVDWTVEDVWEYLKQHRLYWGSSHAVRTLYRDATGECGFRNPKGTVKQKVDGCGARFGCWVCPVVTNDQSTEKLSTKHSWMEPLTRYRELQMKITGNFLPSKQLHWKRGTLAKLKRIWGEANDEINKFAKSGHNRNGKRMADDRGTLTVEVREYLFRELLKTETEVNKIRRTLGMDTLSLISTKEKKMIVEQWEKDREETPHLITNVNGYTADDALSAIGLAEELEAALLTELGY